MPTEEQLKRDTTPPKTDDTPEDYSQQRRQAVREGMKQAQIAPLVKARQEYEGQRERWEAERLAQLRSHPEFRRGFEETYDVPEKSLDGTSEEVGRLARGARENISKEGRVSLGADNFGKRHDFWARIPGNRDPYTKEYFTIYNDPYELGKAEGAEAARQWLLTLGSKMDIPGIEEEAREMAGTEEQRVRERWEAKRLANTGGWEPSEEEREEYERRWAEKE